MLNSVMALHSLGHDESHPTIASNLRKLEELEIEAGDTIRLQPCLSPVWDTALVINAMVEAGCSPSDPEIVEGTRWLLEKEVRDPGDWNQRVRDLDPGRCAALCRRRISARWRPARSRAV